MKPKIRILPSLLAADFGNLEAGARLAEASGADELHVDVMDGHFVPNLSVGPDVVRMARECIGIPISSHLMVTNPEDHVQTFVEAGSDAVYIHAELDCDVAGVLRRIRDLGAKAGITLNPDTPAREIEPMLEQLDGVLCMSVHPGYCGQKFIADVLPKIEAIRAMGAGLDIMVDGGITAETAPPCAARGANSFVAGSFLYRADDMEAEIARMREAVEQAAT